MFYFVINVGKELKILMYFQDVSDCIEKEIEELDLFVLLQKDFIFVV